MADPDAAKLGYNRKHKDKNDANAGSSSNKKQDVIAGQYGNGNVNNIKMRLAHAYGSESANKVTFDELVAKFRAEHGEGSVVTTGTPGSYNYNAVFTIDGKKTDDLTAITKATAKYLVDGGGSTDTKDLKDEKLNYLTANSAKVVTNRFGRAFGGGDVTKGQEVFNQAIAAFKAKNPDKIREKGTPGSAGYSVKVKVNGEWSSKADDIAMVLGRHVVGVDLKGKKDKKVLPKNIANRLDGANGKAVTDRFLSMYGPENYNTKLDSALTKYKKAGGKVKEHGVRGQNGYYIELITEKGNRIVDTDKIMKRLDKYAQGRLATPYIAPPVTPSPAPATEPTPTPAEQNSGQVPSEAGTDGSADGSPSQPDTSTSEPNTEDPSSDSTSNPDSTSDSDSSDYESTSDSGSDSASPETAPDSAPETTPNTEVADKLRQIGLARQEESNSFNKAGASGVNVDIGEAARKSEAMMAFDLDGNGKYSDAEKSLMANGDQNNNGIVGEYGLKKFVAQADTNKSGLVSQQEVKAYNVLDTNNNNKISAGEVKAYSAVDKNNDGDISKKEAKKALQAQIDNKKDQKEHDLAQEYLAKSNAKGGGAQAVDEQVAALVNAQPKHDRSPKDNDGPGKKKKKD